MPFLDTLSNAVGAVGRLGSANPFRVGKIAFAGLEIPGALKKGSKQRLVVHKLPGGYRVIDNAGNDPDRYSFSGYFSGADAFQRAQAMDALYNAGDPVEFQSPSGTEQVVILSYSYDYTRKGAWIPFQMQLERFQYPPQPKPGPGSTSALQKIIGPTAAGAIKTVTDGIKDVSSTVQDVAGQLNSYAGQLMPLAQIVGLGGPLAKATGFLGQVGTITNTATNIANVPESLANTMDSLKNAGTNLLDGVTKAGANISHMAWGSTPDVPVTAVNVSNLIGDAEITSATTEAGYATGQMYNAYQQLTTPLAGRGCVFF